MSEKTKDHITRSFTLPEAEWRRAQKVAKEQGQSMSFIIRALVAGYTRGIYTLPKLKTTMVFPSPARTE